VPRDRRLCPGSGSGAGSGSTVEGGLGTRVLEEAEYPAWNRAGRSFGRRRPLQQHAGIPGRALRGSGGSFRILASRRVTSSSVASPSTGADVAFGHVTSRRRLLLYYKGSSSGPTRPRYPSHAPRGRTKSSRRWCVDRGPRVWTRHLRSRSSLTDVRVFSRGEAGPRAFSTATSFSSATSPALGPAWSRISGARGALGSRGSPFTEDDDFDQLLSPSSRSTSGRARPLPSTGGLRAFLHWPEDLGLARLYLPGCLKGDPCRPSWSFSAAGRCDTRVRRLHEQYLSLGATPFLRGYVFKSLSEQGFTSNDLTDAASTRSPTFRLSLGGDLHLCLLLEGPESARFRWRGRRPRGRSASPSEEIAALAGRSAGALRRRDGSA